MQYHVTPTRRPRAASGARPCDLAAFMGPDADTNAALMGLAAPRGPGEPRAASVPRASALEAKSVDFSHLSGAQPEPPKRKAAKGYVSSSTGADFDAFNPYSGGA